MSSVLCVEEQIEAFFCELTSDFTRVLVVKERCWTVEVATVGDLQ